MFGRIRVCGRKRSAAGALEVGTFGPQCGETVHDRTTRPRLTCAWDLMDRRKLGCRLQSRG